MYKVFSFSLFGPLEKYSRGLMINIHMIQNYFPDWHIHVWLGNGVLEETIKQLAGISNLTVFPTNEDGFINASYRFFSIDDDNVEVMIVRDADSRVNERDRACIEDFVTSQNMFHIIRDHPNHHHLIMAGMWGIKQGLLQRKMSDIFQEWKNRNNVNDFWSDTNFLKSIYTIGVYHAMIHDDLHHVEPAEKCTPHRVPLDERKLHFIGQVYEFSHGDEYPKYPYYC